MVCHDVIQVLEQLSPTSYACSWDNVGLLVGRRMQPVHKIVVGLDATDELIQYAIQEQADMIVTHHPMIFSSMKRMNDDDFIGRKVLSLVEHGIAYYAMHTNFDIKGSMADLAAHRMGMEQTIPLEVTVETESEIEGIGRIGSIPATTLGALAEQVKAAFDLKHVLLYGDRNTTVHTIAISPGSGKSVISEAIAKGADVLVTGDIGHHDGLDAMEQGLSIIDAGHYGLEHIFIDYIKHYMEQVLDIEVRTWKGGVPYEIV